VSALIASDSSSSADLPKFDWPLSRPIASIPGLVVGSGNGGVGARFDDPADCAKLRELRAAATMPHVSSGPSLAGGMIVRENGMEYTLLVRDELPDDAERAWKALDATVPLPPTR
jgi:hypothetical protein